MRAVLLFGGMMICGATIVEASVFEIHLLHPKNDQLVSKLLSKDVAPRGFVKDTNGYKAAASLQRVAMESGYADYLAKFETPNTQYAFRLMSNKDVFEPMYVYSAPLMFGDVKIDENLLSDAEIVTDNEGCYAIKLTFEPSDSVIKAIQPYKSHGSKNPSNQDRDVVFVIADTIMSVASASSVCGSTCVVKMPKFNVIEETARNYAVGMYTRLVLGDWVTSDGNNLTKSAIEWKPNGRVIRPFIRKRIELRDAILKNLQPNENTTARTASEKVKSGSEHQKKALSRSSEYKLLHKMELCDCVVGEIYELRGYTIGMTSDNDDYFFAINPFQEAGLGFRLLTKKGYLMGDKIKDGTLVKYVGIKKNFYGERERAFEEVLR